MPAAVWAQAWASSADAMLVLGPDFSVRYANHAGARALGLPDGPAGPRPVWSLLPELAGGVFESCLRAVALTGEPTTWEMGRPGGDWFDARAYPVEDRIVVVLHDAGARRRAERDRAELMARMQVLLSLASALARTDTVEDVARAVLEVARDHLGADYAVLSMIEGRWLTTTVLGQVDASVERAWSRMPLDHPGPATQVARTGRALVFETFEELVAAFPAARERLERSGLRSGAVLPLTVAGDHRIGSFSLAWHVERAITDNERVLLTAVVDATAQAARRAQLYAERADVARTLQNAMLPELPRLDGLDVAGRYLPASPNDEQVGGDWYDALALPGGASLFVIGDVTGHDVQAAAGMGQVRSMLRALAVDGPQESPASLVTRLDRALDQLGTGVLATLVVARLDPPGERRRLRWSTAGHPPPLLVDDGGRSTVLDHGPDLPLGVDPSRTRHDHDQAWPPTATLVLYTDGLVERRDRDVWEGIALVRHQLALAHGLGLADTLGRVLDRHPEHAEDDCAVLAVRGVPAPVPAPPAVTAVGPAGQRR